MANPTRAPSAIVIAFQPYFFTSGTVLFSTQNVPVDTHRKPAPESLGEGWAWVDSRESAKIAEQWSLAEPGYESGLRAITNPWQVVSWSSSGALRTVVSIVKPLTSRYPVTSGTLCR